MKNVIQSIENYTQEQLQAVNLTKEKVVETIKNVSLTNNDVFRRLLLSNDTRSKNIAKQCH